MIPYFSKTFLVGDITSLNLLVAFLLLFWRSVFPAKWLFGKVLCSQTLARGSCYDMSHVMRKAAFCIYDFTIKNYVVDCQFCHDKEILKSTHSMCFMEN